MRPFAQQIEGLQADTFQSALLFAPELAICMTIVGLLLVRILAGRRVAGAAVALVGSAVGLGLAIQQCCSTMPRTEIFTGMLVYDELTVFFRIFLLAFSVLFILFTWRSGIPDREDSPDIYTLALGATLGMCLMASANHLLIVFLAVEMASVPSYALAGMLKGRRQSSEAALKFSIYGAGTAGIMLYGISLLSGVLGSAHLPTAAVRLAEELAMSPSGETLAVLSLGGLMVMVGLAFKLSAFPFHFWAPDVFEGAAAEIGGFLSVASKGAALALLVRVALGFGYLPQQPAAMPPGVTVALSSAEPASESPVERSRIAALPAGFAVQTDEKLPAATEKAPGESPLEQHAGADKSHAAAARTVPKTRAERMAALAPARSFMGYLIGFLAAITATFGNLAAYGQTNIKRLLAYSTIAHAGIMMMPVAAAMLLAGESATGTAQAVGAVGFYVVMYLFMNLGAFAIVAFLRNELRSEEIADYAGLIHRAPGVALCFSVILISLLGLPPLSGFVAKVVAFLPLADAGWITLLLIGCVNGFLSLFYYLRVVKVMCMDPAPDDAPPVRFPLLTSVNGWLVLVLTVPLLWFGVLWSGVWDWAVAAARSIL
ncbi:MAG: NADH-quinone oxidoreductase subunit N [Planctomycetia bacterium]|nr:NADH-quinone oxidoreductase subunit N [Planctomycetia bacterium]